MMCELPFTMDCQSSSGTRRIGIVGAPGGIDTKGALVMLVLILLGPEEDPILFIDQLGDSG